MKEKLFNWSCNTTTKDKLLNSIKIGINKHLNDSFFERLSLRRILKSIRHNITLVIILVILITSNIYSYTKGIDSKDPEINGLVSELESINNNYGIQSELLDGHKYNITELQTELLNIKSSRIYMKAVIKQCSNVDLPDRVENSHLLLMFEQADKYDLPYTVFFRVIRKESNFKWWVTSSAGAHGYMQVMPPTYKSIAKKLNLPYTMTPESNIKAGAYYLRKKYNEYFKKIIHKKIYDKYDININTSLKNLTDIEKKLYYKEEELIKSDTSYYNNENIYVWELALSAYNAGSSNVKYSVPNIDETRKYVKFILKPYYTINY